MSVNQPTLVVLAAGMGSRYGGLKQIDPVGPSGENIMDYAVYDAIQAGFGEVVFIVRRSFVEAFDDAIASTVKRHIPCRYAFQDPDDLPLGYAVPEGREKPWGTAHALYAAREAIDRPFAVVGADDFFGRQAFFNMRDVLARASSDDGVMHGGMCVWRLGRTLSAFGTVSRGVCAVEDGRLVSITETHRIEPVGRDARFPTADGTFQTLPGDTPVSMNFWGFPPEIIDAIGAMLPTFLDRALAQDPMTAEFALPDAVDILLKEGRLTIDARTVDDRWYGVTNREDRAHVVDALKAMADRGLYPASLWHPEEAS
ncbi:MAG: nucleotidyltransferase family protein [Saccharofermentanales bacterium]|jgi:hypothetical protein